jgi:hypothetical protein
MSRDPVFWVAYISLASEEPGCGLCTFVAENIAVSSWNVYHVLLYADPNLILLQNSTDIASITRISYRATR